jgi:hypothetical protein
MEVESGSGPLLSFMDDLDLATKEWAQRNDEAIQN